ncbi:sugar ABC transporter permease [Clostridium estertheticum]|uniref:Sugar ABC transporter permease n=2 Tax=Clostridium estertheticum TaxID=238834 RepID=A0A5N7IMA1_9CLOT|nr:sugar ABC transporter permease [Clostridium estertheticum]MPQ62122.1 sugar ABC transporter permease [Clostridium estertheticum]
MAEIRENINKSGKILKVKKVKKNKKITWKMIKSQKELMFMSVPFLVYIAVFAYAPIWGWLMAFQNYKPGVDFFHQTWVGLAQFKSLFSYMGFIQVLRNTVAMSLINLVLGMACPIILALLLNEIKSTFFKRTVQTISYLPHFLSWIIATGIIADVLSTDPAIGIINNLLMQLHFISKPILFLGIPKMFWGIVGVSTVWKEVGWGTIIYLSAISSIDPALYEAAEIDGAGRFQKMRHITLTGIKATIIILLIMNIGHILDAGFEIQYFLGNGLVSDYSKTIDIFVLDYGINQFNYSLATAAGIFKSAVSITMLLLANFISGKVSDEKLI